MRKDFVTWHIYEYVLTTYDGIFDDIFSRLDHNHKCSLMEYSAWDFTFNHRWSSRKVRKIQASKPCGWNHTQIKIWLSENMVPLNPMVNDHFPHKQWPFRRVFSPCIQDPYENWTSTKPWDLSPILTIQGWRLPTIFFMAKSAVSWSTPQFVCGKANTCGNLLFIYLGMVVVDPPGSPGTIEEDRAAVTGKASRSINFIRCSSKVLGENVQKYRTINIVGRSWGYQ